MTAAEVSNHDLATVLFLVGIGCVGLGAYLAYVRAPGAAIICAVVGLACIVVAL